MPPSVASSTASLTRPSGGSGRAASEPGARLPGGKWRAVCECVCVCVVVVVGGGEQANAPPQPVYARTAVFAARRARPLLAVARPLPRLGAPTLPVRARSQLSRGHAAAGGCVLVCARTSSDPCRAPAAAATEGGARFRCGVPQISGRAAPQRARRRMDGRGTRARGTRACNSISKKCTGGRARDGNKKKGKKAKNQPHAVFQCSHPTQY